MSERIKGNDIQYFGTITEKSAPSSKKMMFSGFVSTTDPDLTGDIVAADAFDKHITQYMERPVYLYQHDKLQPIGRVSNVLTNYTKDGKTGLYLEEVVLSDIPVVREVIYPLIQDDVLTQQSVGMFSLKGKMQGDLYVHTEVYLYECSLVTVAANPEALIDTVKGLEDFKTIQQLMKAYDEGKIPLKKQYSMYTPTKTIREEPMNITNAHPTTPDFADAIVLKANTAAYDPDGVVIPMPTKVEKNFVSTCENTHVCKSVSRSSYMFQIAHPTEKGFKYDWDLVATAMCRVLGANGGAHFEKDAKVEIIERISEAYRALNKELPTVAFDDGGVIVTIDKVSSDALSDVEFKNVSFKNEESEVYKSVVFENDVKRVADTIKSWKKSNKELVIPANAKESLKYIFTSIDIEIQGSGPDDADDTDFLQALIALIAAYRIEEEDDDDADDAVSTVMSGNQYYTGLSDTEKTTVKELAKTAVEKWKSLKTEEIPVVETTENSEDLEELTKSLQKLGIFVVENK